MQHAMAPTAQPNTALEWLGIVPGNAKPKKARLGSND